MRVLELSVVYFLVGFGSAGALLVFSQGRRIGEACLLVLFWPLYGPFLLMDRAGPKAVRAGWEDFLPNAELRSRLMDRMDEATGRVEEIDRLLAGPDLDERAAADQIRRLEDRGARRAAARVEARLANIRRLKALRQRFSADLCEIEELLTQLRVQSAVVRLTPQATDDTHDLMGELETRLDGLDAFLALETLEKAPTGSQSVVAGLRTGR